MEIFAKIGRPLNYMIEDNVRGYIKVPSELAVLFFDPKDIPIYSLGIVYNNKTYYFYTADHLKGEVIYKEYFDEIHDLASVEPKANI